MTRSKSHRERELEKLIYYQMGLVDAEIALRCGVGSPAICTWRKRMELPSNLPLYPVPEGDEATKFIRFLIMVSRKYKLTENRINRLMRLWRKRG